MRSAGTLLLAVGFLTLSGAVLIRDPAALDANIGAGILSLAGIPAGALGLALLIADRLRRRRQHRVHSVIEEKSAS